MHRRHFLSSFAAATCSVLCAPHIALAERNARYDRLLVLVELKGGNDGLNTVVPHGDRDYYRLRPRLAIPRERTLPLDDRCGLHPALEPLMTSWRSRELAVLRGVGYPDPNLSHFRSIAIWDTASAADQVLDDGWVARVFAQSPPPATFAADGVVVGSAEGGPLEGAGSRILRLTDTAQFLRQARLAAPGGRARNAALEHILSVEANIAHAAQGLDARRPFSTVFPSGPFGAAVRTACEAIGSHGGVAAVKLSLGGFDTHTQQLGRHEALLKELAAGLAALRSALVELNRWNDSLVITYAEFGRRPKENDGGGTDHGTASAHFALGGKVRGGLYGEAPRLDRLDAAGNVHFSVDFRDVLATVMERWWDIDSRRVLNATHRPLDFL
ncbi:MAG: DUF1501 domain-containing protein [Burkholderiales bacterium]